MYCPGLKITLQGRGEVAGGSFAKPVFPCTPSQMLSALQGESKQPGTGARMRRKLLIGAPVMYLFFQAVSPIKVMFWSTAETSILLLKGSLASKMQQRNTCS